MKTISSYEKFSDQFLNKDKCFFMVINHTDDNIVTIIKEETGFSQKIALLGIYVVLYS